MTDLESNKLFELAKRLIVFLGFLGIITVALFFFSNNISPIYEFEKNRWKEIENRRDIKSVVLGNSQSRSIYSPDRKDMYFMSSSAEDMFETLAKAKRIITLKPDIQCVYINVSPLSSIYSNKDFRDQNRIKFYNINKNSSILENDYKLYLKGLLTDILRPDKWSSVLSSLLKPSNNELSAVQSGRESNKYFYGAVHYDVRERAGARGAYHEKLIVQLGEQNLANIISSIEESISTFTSFLDDNKWNGQLIFFTPPTLKEYYQSFSGVYTNKSRQLFKDLSADNPLIHYFDISLDQENAEWQDVNLYYDHHMNINGAKKFTQELNNRVLLKNIDCQLTNN